MLIISFFVVWGFVLVVFKCIPPKFIGVLSGYPYKKEGCKATSGRLLLGFSSLSIILLAIIMVTKGLSELQYASDVVDHTNQDVTKIHDELTNLSTYLKEISRQVTPVRDQLVSILSEDICPLRPGTIAETTVRAMGNDTLARLQNLDDFIASPLEEMGGALDQVDHATTTIDSVIQSVQFTSGQVTAIMLPYFIVPAFMVVAVIMGWFDVFSEGYYTFMTWFILPLMVLMTMFAFVASGWVVLSVEGNSDFCYETPEQNIQKIMAQYSLTDGQMYYDTVMFYAQQCSSTANPWTFLETYHTQLVSIEMRVG
jgi:hypothetical protein